MAATGRKREKFEDYDGFVEKFKPKKTTDDCYTPPEVMECVNRYVSGRWGLDPATFVRPFYPGGNYEAFDYPDGCAVVDNPPFSILAKIQAFYLDRGIPFFLFAPSLTCLSGKRCMEVDHIIPDADIEYENGAKVRTAFVTSLPSDYVIESEPEFGDELNAVIADLHSRKTVKLPRYEYPDAVLTAARCQWMAAHHQPFRVRKADARRISCLDSMRDAGKSGIFGGGLLLSRRAAAERAALKIPERWSLSQRELEMQAELGGDRDGDQG